MISLPAGLAHMPVGRFLLFTAAGSAIWNVLLILGGKALAAAEPPTDGWTAFAGLDLATRQLTLVLTALEGASYTTLSEVEVWGDPE